MTVIAIHLLFSRCQTIVAMLEEQKTIIQAI